MAVFTSLIIIISARERVLYGALTFLARTSTAFAGCILIFFVVIMLIRDERARKIEFLPMKPEQLDSSQAQLVREFRLSAKMAGASYHPLDGARIGFSYSWRLISCDSANSPCTAALRSFSTKNSLPLHLFRFSSRDGFGNTINISPGDFMRIRMKANCALRALDRDYV